MNALILLCVPILRLQTYSWRSWRKSYVANNNKSIFEYNFVFSCLWTCHSRVCPSTHLPTPVFQTGYLNNTLTTFFFKFGTSINLDLMSNSLVFGGSEPSVGVHHKLFDIVDAELQMIIPAPCDQALCQWCSGAWRDVDLICSMQHRKYATNC